MPVEAVDERLDGGFVQVAQVGGRLPRLLAVDQRLWVYKAEGIDDDFALDGLNGVNDDGDGAGGELLEGLLRVDVDGGEPAAEAGMGMVPAYYCFRSADSSQMARQKSVMKKGAYRPVCLNMSIILVWKTGSTASTLTPVPL